MGAAQPGQMHRLVGILRVHWGQKVCRNNCKLSHSRQLYLNTDRYSQMVIEGKTEGRTEVTGRRGEQLLDGVK
jgi:hypothetical protein